jgi:uncharacterized protein (TIGR00255 family)
VIKSMTGYGKVVSLNERYEIEIELRSVNSRYLDLKIHAPREINKWENVLRNMISTVIKRGKVDLMIRVKEYSPPQLELDEAKLKAYWQLYKQAAEVVSSDEPLSLRQIMNEKGIINLKESENGDLKDQLEIILKETIDKHCKIAISEGESMLISLQESITICLNSLSIIKEYTPEHKKLMFAKLKKNIENLLESKLDDNDLKRVMLEASIYVEKSDINEEIVRLNDHIEKFENTLRSDNISVGKSLNFILQEMHREINTIGSKFSNKESYDHILTIKEEIEKCREIIQNVE